MKLRSIILLILAIVLNWTNSQSFAESDLPAAASVKLDLSELDRIPIYFRGRIMPWQSFARRSAQDITGRENPKVLLQHELLGKKFNSADYDSKEMARARALIYGGERKFDASEILLSWLVEPEVWEDIPFILAEHDKLRELLELPANHSEDKSKLRYVSPRQLAESEPFMNRLRAIQKGRQDAEKNNETFTLSVIDRKASDLWKSYRLYRSLTTTPVGNRAAPSHFVTHADSSLAAFGRLNKNIRQIPPELLAGDIGQSATQAATAAQKIINALPRPMAPRNNFSNAQVESDLVEYKIAAANLAETFGSLKTQVFKDAPDELQGEHFDRLKTILNEMASDAKKNVCQCGRGAHRTL